MSKTPYKDLSSEGILSAHISGLQHDINKIQSVLDMKTSSITNHRLLPVDDQDDALLNYRIYEGSIRNWLETPKVEIYRNGSLVNDNEYVIQEAYGVIVFNERQNPNDTITANFSYIDSDSNIISNINIKINEILERLDDIGGGGGDVPDNYNILGGVSPFYNVSNSYMSHQKRFYDPVTTDGYNTKSHTPSFRVLVYGNTLDAFPFPVTTTTTFKQAGLMLGSGTSARARIGLYKDNGSLYPSELVFQSPIFTVNEGEWGYADIDVTIQPGLYWIARHDGDTANWNGLADDSVIHLQRFNGEVFLRELAERPNPFETYGGYRATNVSFGNMPDPFPSGISPFKRAHYCSPWLITR